MAKGRSLLLPIGQCPRAPQRRSGGKRPRGGGRCCIDVTKPVAATEAGAGIAKGEAAPVPLPLAETTSRPTERERNRRRCGQRRVCDPNEGGRARQKGAQDGKEAFGEAIPA